MHDAQQEPVPSKAKTESRLDEVQRFNASMNRQFVLIITVLLAVMIAIRPGYAHHYYDDDKYQSMASSGLERFPMDATSSATMGCRILLMRHAEKPADDENPHLSDAGQSRAQKLVKFITSRYGRPDFIFVAATSKSSSRPYETAFPLSQATGVPIDTEFKDKNFEELAEVLTHDPRFAGKLVVVVWHHGKIPAFSDALHAKIETYPQEWPSNTFDKILEFDFVGKKHPVVSTIQEPF